MNLHIENLIRCLIPAEGGICFNKTCSCQGWLIAPLAKKGGDGSWLKHVYILNVYSNQKFNYHLNF